MPPKVDMLKLYLPSVCVSASTFHVWLYFSLVWTDCKITCLMCLTYQDNVSLERAMFLPLQSFVTMSLCYNETLLQLVFVTISIFYN